MARVPDKVLIDAIIKHRGILAQVARSVGRSRQAVNDRVKRNPKLQAAVKEARATFIDDGENALVKAVKNQEAWAVSLLLKTLGKNRGYVEKQELGVDGNLTIQIIKFSDCNNTAK
jgi:hypothetical protein